MTYQGQLKRDGVPANGLFDFQFTLLQTDGVTRVDRTCAFDLVVVNGLFQADLELAASSLDGSPRLLQIGVRPAAGGIHDCTPNTIGFLFELLTPLQPINASPYALHAFSAPTGSSLNAADGSPVNAVVVDAVGRVGIGTLAPETNLHVLSGVAAGVSVHANTNLIIEDNATNYLSFVTPIANESGVLFANESNSQNGGILFNTSGNPSGLQFRTGGNNTRMAIDAVGNVGIATTAPVNRLSVTGGANFTGSVGIGTPSPSHRLHVSNGSSGGVGQSGADLVVEDDSSCIVSLMSPSDATRGISFGSPASPTHGAVDYSDAQGLTLRTGGNQARLVIDPDGDVGIGVTGGIDARLHVQETGRVAKFDRFGSDGEIVAFARDDIVVGNITNSGGTVSYNAFTGSHYAWSVANIPAGALVSMTGVNRRFGDRSDAEVVFGVQETTRPNDPACLGVQLGQMESARESGPENPLLIAAVGNGELCVVDSGNGDIEPGDYLISSDVSGCAMKDDPARFLIGHVIAKSAQRIRWNDVNADEYGIKKLRGSVLFDAFARAEDTKNLREQIARLEAVLSIMQVAKGE